MPPGRSPSWWLPKDHSGSAMHRAHQPLTRQRTVHRSSPHFVHASNSGDGRSRTRHVLQSSPGMQQRHISPSTASYLAGTAAEEYSPTSLPRAAAGRLRTKRVTGSLVEGAGPLGAEESMAAYKSGLPNARMGLRNQAELPQSYERKWLRCVCMCMYVYCEKQLVFDQHVHACVCICTYM